MLKHGNGKLEIGVRNLILLRQGEVQIGFLRGMDPRYADMPTTSVLPLMQADALLLADNYDYRLKTLQLSLTADPENPNNYKLQTQYS